MHADFQHVDKWDENALDRTQSSRMGWSDVALCLAGPVVQDLRTHFTQRWNLIYDEKYSKKATRYARLPDTSSGAQQGGTYPPPNEQRGFEGGEEGQRGFGGEEAGERGLFGHGGGFRQKLYEKANEGYHQYAQHDSQSHAEHGAQRGGSDCQITRSSAKWSHNITTEVRRQCGEDIQDMRLVSPANYVSTQSKTHMLRSLRTLSTLSTSRTSSSSLPPVTSRSRLRTKSVRPWWNASFVLLVMAKSTR
jgi:phosphatidylserine/phosphatidylglycerophosphate/cardiolipin synthase-like enzyme